VVMSYSVLVLLSIGALAVVPLALTSARMALRRARVMRPLVLVMAGAGIFVLGSRHFGNGWPGTGGHPWAHQGLVPGGVAAFSWASTLSVTSYWMHPTALSTFPLTEVAWMIASPVAMAMVVVGCAKIVRRAHLSAR